MTKKVTRIINVPNYILNSDNVGFDVRFGFIDLSDWSIISTFKLNKGDTFRFEPKNVKIKIVDLEDQLKCYNSVVTSHKKCSKEALEKSNDVLKDIEVRVKARDNLVKVIEDSNDSLPKLIEELKRLNNLKKSLEDKIKYQDSLALKMTSVKSKTSEKFKGFLTKADVTKEGIIKKKVATKK